MKTYTIELYAYPQEFVISANSEDEAMEKAKERFEGSVYESKVVDVTGEILDDCKN